MKLLNTNLFVVLDEETLTAMKDNEGHTAKFDTYEDANEIASQSLNMWSVVHVNFNDTWLQHKV
jgi:hypothetical protein